MTELDWIIFLIVGILGTFGASITLSGKEYSLAWVLLAVYSLLRILHLFA